jgi:hypothetical protein
VQDARVATTPTDLTFKEHSYRLMLHVASLTETDRNSLPPKIKSRWDSLPPHLRLQLEHQVWLHNKADHFLASYLGQDPPSVPTSRLPQDFLSVPAPAPKSSEGCGHSSKTP